DHINSTLSAQQEHNKEAAEALEKAIRALMVDKPLPSLADAAVRAAFVHLLLPAPSNLSSSSPSFSLSSSNDSPPPLSNSQAPSASATAIDPTDPTDASGHTAASSLAKSVSASEDRFSLGSSGEEHAGCENFCATCIRPLNCSLMPSLPCSCCRRPDTPANVADLDGELEDDGDGGGDTGGGVTKTGAQGVSESCEKREEGVGGGGGAEEEGGGNEGRKPACADGMAKGRWVNYTWWEADDCEY
ncbi:unnamed protein product, partial [Closterium sp. NIES-53]